MISDKVVFEAREKKKTLTSVTKRINALFILAVEEDYIQVSKSCPKLSFFKEVMDPNPFDVINHMIENKLDNPIICSSIHSTISIQ